MTVYIGEGTAQLRAKLPDIIEQKMFAKYGQLGRIIRQSEPLYGQLEGSETPGPEFLLYIEPAARDTQRNAAGAGLPVPSYTAYVLCRDAPDLGTPGWALEVEGVRYHPSADARNEASQGLVWELTLLSPGQLSDAL